MKKIKHYYISLVFFLLWPLNIYADNKCKDNMTDVFGKILSEKKYEKYASMYNLLHKNTNSKYIFEQINLLKTHKSFRSTTIYCKYGIGFLKGDVFIDKKVYSLIMTFFIEDNIWKFNTIKLIIGDQKIIDYLDLDEEIEKLKSQENNAGK